MMLVTAHHLPQANQPPSYSTLVSFRQFAANTQVHSDTAETPKPKEKLQKMLFSEESFVPMHYLRLVMFLL